MITPHRKIDSRGPQEFYGHEMPDSFYDFFQAVEDELEEEEEYPDRGRIPHWPTLFEALRKASEDPDLPDFAPLPDCLPPVRSHWLWRKLQSDDS